MISKQKAIIGALVIILVTSLLTFSAGNYFALEFGERVLISKERHENINNIMKTHRKFLEIKEFLMENYLHELDEEMLIDGAIRGMFESIGDPYTVFMDEGQFEDMKMRTQGSYGGIGIIVTPGDDGFVTVVSPIEDTPGERAGIISGDRIIAVDGTKISADKLDFAVTLMRGEPGTPVILSISRDGEQDLLDIEIERAEIRLKTVRSEVIEDNIGYIRISLFDEQTAESFKKHLDELEKKAIKGLVIDLRNNPGGLLSQCIEIADILLGEQIIVYTEDRDGRREIEKSDKNKVDIPLIVLVNNGSASASEILAGAIQDTNSGLIVGTTTFGKGVVQQIKSLHDGTGIKYTISQYFTPNGSYIHGKGIEPDVYVELPEQIDGEVIHENVDLKLDKAIEIMKEQISE